MAMARTDPAAAPPPPSAEEPWYPSRSVDLRRWTWDAYMAIVEAGILAPGERVELIEGVVVRMAPQRTPHATAITLAQYRLLPVFGAGLVVRVQLPLALGPYSAPEPDIAVVTGAARDSVQAHPSTAVLVLEIAEHTLAYDRGEKASLYARAGIPDYWVLNLGDRQLEVCREPSPLPGEPLATATAVEIGRRLGVGKGTAHRLLASLVAEGFVTQDQASERYCLGFKLVSIAGAVDVRHNLRRDAHPLLVDLSRRCGETISLGVLDHDACLLIDVVPATTVIRVDFTIGAREPLHCCSVGKALLAGLPRAEAAALVRRLRLKRYTPRTITTVEGLERDLALIAARGFALDDEEYVPGLRCLAVPIRDVRGQVVAAMSVSSPSQRRSLAELLALAPAIRATADAIAVRLGCTPAAAAPALPDVGDLWGQMATAATLALIPLAIVVFLLQRHIVRGMTLGAIK